MKVYLWMLMKTKGQQVSSLVFQSMFMKKSNLSPQKGASISAYEE
jgi:hypothetical protein